MLVLVLCRTLGFGLWALGVIHGTRVVGALVLLLLFINNPPTPGPY